MIRRLQRLYHLVKAALVKEKEMPPKNRSPEDSEFLPAALEILETVPSRFARVLMLTICTIFFFPFA